MGGWVETFMVHRDVVRRPPECAIGNFFAAFDDSSRCASGFGRRRGEGMDLNLFRYAFVVVNNLCR